MTSLIPEDIPFHLDVNQSVHKVQYGDVQFSVSIHNGKVVTYTAIEFEERKYQSNPDAIAQLLSYVKGITDKKNTGQYTFTILAKDGIIKMIVYQKHEKKVYNPNK